MVCPLCQADKAKHHDHGERDKYDAALLPVIEYKLDGPPQRERTEDQKQDARDQTIANVVMTLAVFYVFKLYHSLWAFAGTAEVQNILAGCILSAILDF